MLGIIMKRMSKLNSRFKKSYVEILVSSLLDNEMTVIFTKTKRNLMFVKEFLKSQNIECSAFKHSVNSPTEFFIYRLSVQGDGNLKVLMNFYLCKKDCLGLK